MNVCDYRDYERGGLIVPPQPPTNPPTQPHHRNLDLKRICQKLEIKQHQNIKCNRHIKKILVPKAPSKKLLESGLW